MSVVDTKCHITFTLHAYWTPVHQDMKGMVVVLIRARNTNQVDSMYELNQTDAQYCDKKEIKMGRCVPTRW